MNYHGYKQSSIRPIGTLIWETNSFDGNMMYMGFLYP